MTIKRYVALSLLERQIDTLGELIARQGDHDITFEQREDLEGIVNLLSDVQFDMWQKGESTLHMFKRDLDATGLQPSGS